MCRSLRTFIVGLVAISASVAAPQAQLVQDSRRVEDAPDPFGTVVGHPVSELVTPGDTLLDIAFRTDVGFEAISNLNPTVDPWIPAPGTVVQIPSQVIVPIVEAEGLVINIPEMRLFEFSAVDGPNIIAAAVGDIEDPTPIGSFQIRDKRVDPVWHVPDSIRAKKPELPEHVEAGPENPLGSRWMRIGSSSYGIHGTNIRWSIGREATHGCVRLYEKDVQPLFERTPEGTRLEIIYQPFKWGRIGSVILLEAHPDRYARISDPLATALAPIRDLGLLHRIDIEKVWETVERARGTPTPVGTLPDQETP